MLCLPHTYFTSFSCFHSYQDTPESDNTETDPNKCAPRDPEEFKKKFRELLVGYYTDDNVWVDMSRPRPCYIQRRRNQTKYETVILGEARPRQPTANAASSFVDTPVEHRGITARQLEAIHKNATRRCEEEEWKDRDGNKVDPKDVNLYIINEYIIKPFTEFSQKSLVETLPSTGGTQPLWMFVSHWWGEVFHHFLACIKTAILDFSWNSRDSHEARGGGMTMDTPIWICAFANNQHDLDSAVTSDPLESSFVKAMKEARFRVLSILDAAGTVFTRIWCAFELFLTMILRKQLMDELKSTESIGSWAVYTHTTEHDFKGQTREAVGIIPGGVPGEVASETSDREKHFPLDLIIQSIRNTNVQHAQASIEYDRIHILNSIIRNNDLDATPPDDHPAYELVNDAVRGAFAMSNTAIRAALKHGRDGTWKMVMEARSKSAFDGKYDLNFKLFHPPLSSRQAFDSVSHVPLTCTGLNIWNAKGETAEVAVEGLIDWLGQKKNVKSARCCHCYVEDEAKRRALGSQLANVLAKRHTQSIEYLNISFSHLMDLQNLSNWTAAIEKMTNLKSLYCYGGGLPEDEQEIVRQAASHVEYVDIT